MADMSGGVREVFPSSPLTLVVVEVRFAGGGLIPSPTIRAQRALKEGLGDGWIIESATEQRFEFTPVMLSSTSVHSENFHRVTMRDRSRVVTLRSESLTIETTKYVHFEDFRTLLEEAMRVVEGVVSPDGIARVGMRYIDEIVVGPDKDVDWSAWMPSNLIPPAATSLDPTNWLSVIEYAVDDEHRLVLRHGPTNSAALRPDGPLRSTRHRAEGPIYTWDFDSSWQPTDIPAFEANGLLTECDRLRDPIRTMFDLLATPQLIDIWRTSPRDS